MATLTYSGTLVVETCWCGIAHAIPSSLREEAQRAGIGIYCPLGHSWVFVGHSENQRLKNDLKWYKDAEARLRSEKDQIERSRRAWKGQTTKLRNRAAEGQCAFCGKFLVDLALHMAKQHPDEHPRELTEDDAS